MVKWVCTSCNFRFESEEARECPYCGRTKTMQKEPSAEDLLDDVEKLLEE